MQKSILQLEILFSRKVVQLIYRTNDDGLIHEGFGNNPIKKESHPMTIWKNLLDSDQMQAMIDTSCKLLLQSGICKKENGKSLI